MGTILKNFKGESLNEEEPRMLKYPFNKLSLEQVIEISKRVFPIYTYDSRTEKIEVNGDVVTNDNDNIYVCLLQFIMLIANQYKKCEELLFKIDRYNYINEIISNTTNYINSCLNNDIEPCPSEIIENSLLESCRLDCTILSNLIEIYGFALNRMTYLIKVAKTDNNLNLSDEAYKLLKILELSKEELKAKYRKNSESYDITKIDLDTWLNDSVNKDISAVLAKTK